MKYTLIELYKLTGLTAEEFAVRTQIAKMTIYHSKSRKVISIRTAEKVLRFLKAYYPHIEVTEIIGTKPKRKIRGDI
jgi:predicted transcriptional regulator